MKIRIIKLPRETDKVELKKFLTAYGSVNFIELKHDPESNDLIGHIHIVPSNDESMNKLNGSFFGGQRIIVDTGGTHGTDGGVNEEPI